MVKLRAAILISITVILFTVGVRVWSDNGLCVVSAFSFERRRRIISHPRRSGCIGKHNYSEDFGNLRQ